jgi:hypothetical protein
MTSFSRNASANYRESVEVHNSFNYEYFEIKNDYLKKKIYSTWKGQRIKAAKHLIYAVNVGTIFFNSS